MCLAYVDNLCLKILCSDLQQLLLCFPVIIRYLDPQLEMIEYYLQIKFKFYCEKICTDIRHFLLLETGFTFMNKNQEMTLVNISALEVKEELFF